MFLISRIFGQKIYFFFWVYAYLVSDETTLSLVDAHVDLNPIWPDHTYIKCKYVYCSEFSFTLPIRQQKITPDLNFQIFIAYYLRSVCLERKHNTNNY